MATSLDGNKRRQAVKRAEILACATELFLFEGYGRVSMDRVHANIGGSKRTLYSYFPSKDDLFLAIVRSVSGRVLDALKPASNDGDLRSALLEMGTDYLTVLSSPEGLSLYRVMVSESAHFPELAKTFFDEGPGRANQYLACFFEQQKAQGVFDVDDTLLAAGQFLGMLRGDLHLRAIFGIRKATKPQIRKAVLNAVDIFLKGISVAD